MQMEPPAVTCPATYSHAYCMVPGSSVNPACTMQCTLHSNMGDISASADSKPQQDRTFWAEPNPVFSHFGTEHTANSML